MSVEGSAGDLATAANILALYHLVLCIVFAVCSAFLLGNHLAFTANLQPDITLPLMPGKLGSGLIAMVVADWIAVPEALDLERQDRERGVIAGCEYLTAGKARSVEEVAVGGQKGADNLVSGQQRSDR